MFDVSQISKRYFDIGFTVEKEDGETDRIELQVEPPTVKQLRKLMSVADSNNTSAMDDLEGAVRSILSKNKTGYIVQDVYVDSLDFDQLAGILKAYLNWVGEEKKAKN